MKNQLKLSVAVIALLFVSFSFTKITNTDVVGKYGDSIMKLTLNEDNTFSYYSSFDSNNKIEAEGTYSLKKGKIVIESKKTVPGLPTEWRLKNDGVTIKSRKGMVFYTLQKEK